MKTISPLNPAESNYHQFITEIARNYPSMKNTLVSLNVNSRKKDFYLKFELKVQSVTFIVFQQNLSFLM
jgi:hypothetical protein